MERFRTWLGRGGGVVAALTLLAFVVGAVFWFIASAKSNGTIPAGDAFVGLGYMAAALFVALLALLAWRLLGLAGDLRPIKRQPRPRGADEEHSIIRTQLAWGSSLVIVGAIVGLICLCLIHPKDAVAGPVLALATAVISAGAVLLPAGAASSASTRLQQQLQSPPPVVNAPFVTRTGDTTASLSGTVAPNRNDVEAYFEFQEMPEQPDAKPTAAVAQVQPTEQIPASLPAQTIRRELTTLEADKAYQVRLAAKGPTGPPVHSQWTQLDAYRPGHPAADREEGPDGKDGGDAAAAEPEPKAGKTEPETEAGKTEPEA